MRKLYFEVQNKVIIIIVQRAFLRYVACCLLMKGCSVSSSIASFPKIAELEITPSFLQPTPATQRATSFPVACPILANWRAASSLVFLASGFTGSLRLRHRGRPEGARGPL